MKLKGCFVFSTICLGLAIALEFLACFCESFTVFYVDNIFPVITVPLSFVSGIFPFSMGEILLYLAVILIIILIIWGLVVLIGKLFCGIEIPISICTFSRFIYLIVGIYSLIMVLNCFILYRYTPMNTAKDMTDEEIRLLVDLRDRAVERANELSRKLDRNEKGEVVLPDSNELKQKCVNSMQSLSKEGYPRLSGYYPQYKSFDIPEFFSQQYIMGYYFPFSMEANVNPLMYSTNFPHTICHELSHLKGYILEDEANFLGYLACMNSGDEFMEYSALLSVLGYLDSDFYEAVCEDKNIYLSHPAICEQVTEDDIFLTEETWEQVNGKSLLDTETVHEASREFTDTVLSTNGVADGIKSYSRVVGLLLEYYKDKPLF